MRIHQIVTATLATVMLASTLVAQQSQPLRAQNFHSQTSQGQSTGNNARTKDQVFAKSLAIANEEQVQISRFAQEHATNDDVKKFAATLEKEHQDRLKQLKEFSPQNESNSYATTASYTQADNTQADHAQANNRDSNVNFLELQQKISTQCLKDSKEMLSSKEGIEFDKTFVGMQIAKHAGMHSVLTVLQDNATGKLQGMIKSELQTNQKHMDAAVSLMDQLAKNDSSKSSRQ